MNETSWVLGSNQITKSLKILRALRRGETCYQAPSLKSQDASFMVADALSRDVQEAVNFGQFRSLAQELEKFVQGHALC